MNRTEVIIIGAGILGLANAWEAARRGYRVRVLERHSWASEASVRNFGMIWPIGQPPAQLGAAMRSRERWIEAARGGGFQYRPQGSLHLAADDAEAAVMQEFAESAADLGYRARWLEGDEVRRQCPAAAETVVGALFSETEIGVDPPLAIAGLTRWLAKTHGVDMQFQSPAVSVDMPTIRCNDGAVHEAKRVVVCSGAETAGLFPEVFKQFGVRRVKLQMMATTPQPAGWRLGALVAGGLSLRRYPAFAHCPSLKALTASIDARRPELAKFGIHVMAAQHSDGAVVIGDSHQYDEAITPFDDAEIDEAILAELRRIIYLPRWRISRRWHGIYTKHPQLPIVIAEPQPGCRVMVAPSGAGMTLAFGLAEEMWEAWG